MVLRNHMSGWACIVYLFGSLAPIVIALHEVIYEDSNLVFLSIESVSFLLYPRCNYGVLPTGVSAGVSIYGLCCMRLRVNWVPALWTMCVQIARFCITPV